MVLQLTIILTFTVLITTVFSTHQYGLLRHFLLTERYEKGILCLWMMRTVGKNCRFKTFSLFAFEKEGLTDDKT